MTAAFRLQRVFVYGTLKSNQAYNRLLGHFRSNGVPAVAKGIVIHVSPGGYPLAARGNGKTLGELFEIDYRTLKALDAFEGHPHDYRREVITVEPHDGEPVKAWIYLNNTAHQHPPIPGGNW